MILRRISKRFINATLLVLVLLCVCVGLYSWLRLSDAYAVTPHNEVVDILVLDSYTDSYNQLLSSVWYQYGVWQVRTPKQLKPGYSYKLRVVSKQFGVDSSSKHDRIRLSVGYSGEMRVLEIQSIYTCDIVCRGYNQIISLRYTLSQTLFHNVCNQYVLPQRLFELSCQDIAGFSSGLLLGATTGINKGVLDSFRELGMSHILVASGFQVVLLVGAVEVLLTRFRLAPLVRLGVSIILLLFFMIMAGPQPPIVRAGISALVSSFVLIFLGRRIHSVRLLIYTALIMLLVHPFYIFSISFQLTVLATLAVSSTPAFTELPSFISHTFKTLWATIVCVVLTLPVLSSLKGVISPLLVVSNILVVPIVPILTLLNTLVITPIVGEVVGVIVFYVQGGFMIIVQDTARESSPLSIDSFSVIETIVYYLCSLVILIVLHPDWRSHVFTLRIKKEN